MNTANASQFHRAMLLMVLSVILWSVIETIGGHLAGHYSEFEVVWTRYAVHLSLMLIFWGFRNPASLWKTKRPLFQIGRSMLMLGMPAAWAISRHLGESNSTVLSVFWLSPLVILLLARWLLHESVPLFVWGAALFAYAGSFFLYEGDHNTTIRSSVFPLMMALCFSLYVVMTRLLREELTRTNLFYTALGVFLALTPFMPSVWVEPSLHDFLMLAAIGSVGLASLYLLDRMSAIAPVSISAPFAYAQVAALQTLVLFGGAWRSLSPRRDIVGVLCIAGATTFVWLRAPRLSGAEPAALATPE